MGPLDLLNHLLNFAAPAAALALLLVLAGRWLAPRTGRPLAWWVQALVIFGVGVAVLVLGLVLWGRDGRMLTYALLVLACTTCQWVLLRSWRG